MRLYHKNFSEKALLPSPQPKQRVDDQLIHICIFKSLRKLFVGAAIIVHSVVADVKIHHAIVFISPGYRDSNHYARSRIVSGRCLRGNLLNQPPASISIFGFLRRSCSQRYHSLGFVLKVVTGKPLVTGWFGSSTCKIAGVGCQVLLTYCPEPKKLVMVPVPVLRKIRRRKCKGRESGNPSMRRPFSYIAQKPRVVQGLSARVSKNITTWYLARNSGFMLAQLLVLS
jgi:hypothetical protein